MLVEATREELVAAVDRRLLGLVHQDELLAQTQPARVVAGPVGLAAGEDPPLHLRLDPLVLEGPDVAAQLGLLPLGCVPERGLVVSVPELPRGGTDAHVLHQGLPLGRHLGLVDDPGVFAPAPFHHANSVLALAVAVGVLQVDGGWGGDLSIVAGHYFAKIGHGSVTQLHCVSVEDLVEGVIRGKASVQELEELPANVGLDRQAERWVEPDYPAAARPLARSAPFVCIVNQILVIPYIYIYIYISELNPVSCS